MIIDTHAHLFYPDYNGELDNVLERAVRAGVEFMLIPSTDMASAADVVRLTNEYDFIYGAIGIHPHDTSEWNDGIIGKLESVISGNKKIVAVGEIGLDYYYDYSPKDQQIKAFRAQMDMALRLNLPVIVHNRLADDDVLNLLREYSAKGLRGQLHCFSASVEAMKSFVDMGFYISFTGNITYKKADDLREVLKETPLNRLLLETDSPFMTPLPLKRGQRNEPANLIYTVEKIAEVKGYSKREIELITTFNAFRAFGIGEKPKKNFTYQLGNSLYVNVTYRCDSDCIFCHRKEMPFIGTYYLGMEKNEEPGAAVYIDEIGDPKVYDEIVFCGYGEPTIRWDIIKEVAASVKKNGGTTRINTNGHGNIINKRDITPEAAGLIDTVSISLNATTAARYAELMRVSEDHYEAMKSFAKGCLSAGVSVVMSVVTGQDIEMHEAQRIAEEEIGAAFRLRDLF